jgi:hypothetical protein
MANNSVTDPLMIAVLVKNLKNIQDAADLIEQYGRTVAAEARVQNTLEVSNRIIGAMGVSDAQA